MSKGLDSNQKIEIAASEVKTRILLTITINNATRDVIKIIENDTLSSFEYGENTYIAAMVKRGQIESRMEGGPQKVNIKISNINQAYSSIIANEGDVLTNSICVIEEVIFDNLNNIVGDSVNIFEGFVNNIQLTETEFSFDVERILGGYSTQSPNTTYDVNCQWVFKDSRCQYSGGETTCDKTFTSCQARSNEIRFGGYPSIPQELVIKG
ncbi:MAG: hypothetical protein A2Y25_12070 [Candidatus Melainabacteria bacterium GWF2_37_15]|nr:MAG: hypothetical protein A2Y25_12070 [Candidatus Melainabacteria bacterium GWF2_37_15]